MKTKEKECIMKKALLSLLTSLLVLSCIGCGAKKTQPETPAPAVTEASTAETTEEETPAPAEVIEPEAEAPQEEKVLPPAPDAYLKELFAEHNMKVGTCLTTQMIDNPTTSRLILDQFNSITMENSMKPDYIFNKQKSMETGDLVVEFNNDMIKMLDWAKANDMAVRGHTLVWHSQTPDWIFYEGFDTKNAFVSRDVMLKRMESYIKQMFEKLEEAGYADMFYAYDVVNEAWMEDGSMRESNWRTIIGDDYLWDAFYYANKYAPENIHLFYNDYNEQFKADTLVKFVNTLVDEDGNYLIDGIGLQAHLYTEDDLNGYFRAVEKLASTGLIVELTELDVSLGAWQKTLKGTDDNLRVQGKYFYDLVKGLFERADDGTIQMDALTFWGFADHMSWRKNASPLLYYKDLTPKYSFYGAMQMPEYAY